MHSCDNAVIEKINVKLCKYLLGVGKRTTNAAVRGELGRYPLLINLTTHSFKYWMKISLLPIESLVRKSYLESMMTVLDMKKQSWASCMYTILNQLNMQELWELQGNFSGTTYSQPFKSSLEKMYATQWKTYISRENVPNKLCTYAEFKQDFKIENYILSLPLKARRNFTKLRISAHRLAIETGRYSKPKTPREERLCVLCNKSEVEDERHMLMECTFYDDERTLFIQSIHEFSNVTFINTPEMFHLFMSCHNGDTEFGKAVCLFVTSSFNKREKVTVQK